MGRNNFYISTASVRKSNGEKIPFIQALNKKKYQMPKSKQNQKCVESLKPKILIEEDKELLNNWGDKVFHRMGRLTTVKIFFKYAFLKNIFVIYLY